MITNSPRHIAIIMDGNRRWAQQNNCGLEVAYKKGAERLLELIQYCIDKVLFLTVYVFSTENWLRGNSEISLLMSLAESFLSLESHRLNALGVMVRFIGERDLISQALRQAIEQCEQQTKNNTKLHLNVAFSYGSRNEILNTVKRIIQNPLKDINKLDEKCFSDLLYTNNCPDPDLLIRTGGTYRISNFLLWQLAYTELFFLEVFWPDFDIRHFTQVLEEYAKRNRTLGT